MRNKRKQKRMKGSDEKALREITDMLDKEEGVQWNQRKSKPVTTSLGDLLREHRERSDEGSAR